MKQLPTWVIWLTASATLLASADTRAADYCIDAVTGSDSGSGLCSTAPWRSFQPSICFGFNSGDRGGSGTSVMLSGTASLADVCHPA